MTIAVVFIPAVFTACKKESVWKEPKPPVANAGHDTTLYLPFNSYMLDGSASTDPDSNIVAYFWRKIDGPSIIDISYFRESKAAASGFVKTGVYLFELAVTDGEGLISKDTIKITVGEAIYTVDSEKVLITGLHWNYSWIMQMDFYDINSYLPPNKQYANYYIKRRSSADWEIIVPLNINSPDYTFHTYQIDGKTFTIFPNMNFENDNPEVKFEFSK